MKKALLAALFVMFAASWCLAQDDTSPTESIRSEEYRNNYCFGCELQRVAVLPGMLFLERRWKRQSLLLTTDIEIDNHEFRRDSLIGDYKGFTLKIGGMWKWYWLRGAIHSYVGLDPTYIYMHSTKEEHDTVSSDIYTIKTPGNGCSISALFGFEVPLKFTSNHVEIGMTARLLSAEMLSRHTEVWKNDIQLTDEEYELFYPNSLGINSSFDIKIRVQATARVVLKYVF